MYLPDSTIMSVYSVSAKSAPARSLASPRRCALPNPNYSGLAVAYAFLPFSFLCDSPSFLPALLPHFPPMLSAHRSRQSASDAQVLQTLGIGAVERCPRQQGTRVANQLNCSRWESRVLWRNVEELLAEKLLNTSRPAAVFPFFCP